MTENRPPVLGICYNATNGIKGLGGVTSTPSRGITEVAVMRTKYTPAQQVHAFWQKVDKSGECWLWTGGTAQGGYGTVRFFGKIRRASRVAWELTNGPIPVGMVICHRCDNPGCVRPSHLFVGTHRDNMQDACEKRRLPLGADRPGAKLTDEAVRFIRQRAQAGETRRSLARAFGVTQAVITSVVLRITWSHVED